MDYEHWIYESFFDHGNWYMIERRLHTANSVLKYVSLFNLQTVDGLCRFGYFTGKVRYLFFLYYFDCDLHQSCPFVKNTAVMMARTKWPPKRWGWCRWKTSMILCNQSTNQAQMRSKYQYFCHAWRMCWVAHEFCQQKKKYNEIKYIGLKFRLWWTLKRKWKVNYSLSAISAMNKKMHVCPPPNEKPHRNLENAKCHGR